MFHDLKHAVPGKAVLVHVIGDAIQQVGVVFQTAQHGKEDGSAPSPDVCVSLPQVLRAVVVAYRGKLSAQVLDVYGETFILNGDDHREGPPLI